MKLFVKTHPYLWFQCSIMNDIDRRSMKTRRKKKEWDNRLPAFLNGWIRNTEEWRWILSIKQILFSTTGDEDDIMWLCISRKEVTKNKPVIFTRMKTLPIELSCFLLVLPSLFRGSFYSLYVALIMKCARKRSWTREIITRNRNIRLSIQ